MISDAKEDAKADSRQNDCSMRRQLSRVKRKRLLQKLKTQVASLSIEIAEMVVNQ